MTISMRVVLCRRSLWSYESNRQVESDARVCTVERRFDKIGVRCEHGKVVQIIVDIVQEEIGLDSQCLIYIMKQILDTIVLILFRHAETFG